MRLRIGLLGLPNVGKSTLLNALAQQSIAEVANYPFCTIDPNTALVPIPDPYLDRLAAQAGHKARPAVLECMDVAGLCKNAHKGEGLGNRFLGNLRECSALVHVIGLFDTTADPVLDAQVIELELLLADLEHVERRLDRKTCTGVERETLDKIKEVLQLDKPVRHLELSKEEQLSIKSMGLLTLKPILFCFNLDDIDFTLGMDDSLVRCRSIMSKLVSDPADRTSFVMVCAKLDSELSKMENESQKAAFLESLGVENPFDFLQLQSQTTLPGMICQMLGYDVVYTGAGVPKERSGTTKAHLFHEGELSADGLASRLHGDIQKGFIRAEVVDAADLLQCKSFADARESGNVRSEGRGYNLKPKEVVLIRWKG